MTCVGAVYTAVEGRNEIRQRDHVRCSSGTGYLLVNTHGFTTLKTAVFVEHGEGERGERVVWRETREGGG